MDTLNKQTEPPGRRKERAYKKVKWPKWLRSKNVVRLVLIWGPRIFRLVEAIYSFVINSLDV